MFKISAGQRVSAGLLRCWSRKVTPRCPACSSRTLSTSAPAQSQTHEGSKQPLKAWALSVSPFSTVHAQLGCSISVAPLDPHAFPEADRALVTVHGSDTDQELGLDHLHVQYDDQSKELLISAEKVNSSVSVDLAAPLKSSECFLMMRMTSRFL